MDDEPHILYNGPAPSEPVVMRFATPDEHCQTWTFPQASGYFLSVDEYHDFKAMQAEWKAKRNRKEG